MKIWMFNHYAQSPSFPGGTRHYDLALVLNRLGCDVTIFASSYHYTLLRELLGPFKLSKEEVFEGVKFVLLKTIRYRKNGVFRFLNILSYPLSLIIHLLRFRYKKPDIIIGSTVHPFAALVGCLIAKFYKIPHVFEIRDLWPETFIDMQLWKKNSLLSRFFFSIEKFTVNRSTAFLTLSPMTNDYLMKKYGVNEGDILLLPNGVNERFYKHLDLNGKDSVLKENRENRVLIKYVGGIDSVHGLEFLIDLASSLPSNYRVELIGDGKDKERLQFKVKELAIGNVTFLPPIPKSSVPAELKNSDLLFLSTADVFYGSENKLYEYMSAAKPIIIASNANHNNPVHDLGCGIVLDRSNVCESADKLKKYIRANHSGFGDIGMLGYNYVVKNRTIPILADSLHNFLKGLK